MACATTTRSTFWLVSTFVDAAKDNVDAIGGAKPVTVSGVTIRSGVHHLRATDSSKLWESAASISSDARVIDGKGLTLTPGLIDGFGGVSG